ncbi:serine hydrolase domain-containing protein [Massilia varians]|uniref:serine hydrolase domain-containing protein n=1 Tax=Massilia varians TaxID=457921 RepID=UPI002556D0BF|nr:serine hydrolase domain-containing protein [Massilia varians]MDK6077874.1 serine hydrolase domain-containing protein [Massilia varians]
MRMSIPFVLMAGLCAGTVRADAIDDAIERMMRSRQVPGLALVVVKDGKIVRERGYGLANVEHGVPVTPDTVFQSASTGKTFTAALILLLEKDGKLKLDDPISRYLDNTPPAWAGITIRHLLTHTSGLGDPYTQIDLRKDYTDEELIALEASMPLLSAPGERFAYSNAGYHLLGFIARRVGGKFFGDQLEERIFAPLGMTSAGVISESDIVPGRAAGYERIDGRLQNQRWVAPSLNRTADGTIALSARDLARWSMALDGDAILDARAKQASWTPARLNDGGSGPYGLGWYVGSRNGHRVVQHGGAWQGFKAALQRYPDERLTIVVLANSAAARQGKIADLVAAHYVPALATPRSPAIADLDPAGTARARKAMEELLAGRIPDGLSASERGRYNQRWVTQIAAEFRDFGPLRAVEVLARGSEGDGKQARYRFLFENETALVAVHQDCDGLIERLGISLE